MHAKERIFYTSGTLVILIAATMTASSFAISIDPSIPSASPVSAATTQDTPVSIALVGTSNDVEAGGALVYATSTSPTHGTLGGISANNVTYTPDAGFTGADSFSYIVTEGATSSTPILVSITVTAPASSTGTAHIVVRDGMTIATSSDVAFTLSGNATIAATAGDTHDIAASSTLAILTSLDSLATEFDISTLEYNVGFGAFYLKCITVPAASTSPDCDNWQYSVNGTTPGAGMDHTVLHDGDTVYVYFASPHAFSLSRASVTVDSPVTVTAQTYDPVAGAYVPTAGFTIGATQPDPSNPWSPFERATSTTDAMGQAIITLAATGTYDIGIKEDYYFPTIALAVTDPPAPTGGGGTPAHVTFNVTNALTFLATQQNGDGSFSNPVITDWAAIAYAAADPGAPKGALRAYLAATLVTYSSVTDYERHAMALEALGINPYTGSPTDAISPIIAAFDGTQIGDASLDNDDIFALLSLTHAGYTQSDDTIRKIAAFVISKQKPDGSWDESVDMTAAAIQALGPLYTIPGYGKALGMAAGYLASTQQTSGGWNSIDSTSWALTAITSIREGDPARAGSWANSAGRIPEDALSAGQQGDGGVVSSGDRAWSTAYAIVAGSGKSWLSVLRSFPKPAAPTGGGGAPSLSATSTDAATTTPIVLDLLIATPTASTTPSIPGADMGGATSTSTTTTKTIPKPKTHSAQKAPMKITRVTATSTQVATVSVAIPDSFFARLRAWFFRLF